MDTSSVRSTCPYCGVGCGVIANCVGDVTEIEGDARHPANYGRLCAKGAQLGATLNVSHRYRAPLLHGAQASWEDALDAVAQRFSQTIVEHGCDSVAFYVSGQLLTEDYYVANKLMKGAIGSANIDTNSRLCMASSVIGHKRAFGADTVPCGYDDLEAADLVVLIGSNLAWCHPVLYQRLQAARQRSEGPALIVIDPRRTPTATDADLHLPIHPGMDAVLFNGLLNWLDEHEVSDNQFVRDATDGYSEAVLAARSCHSISDVAERCGLTTSDVKTFYRMFAATEKTVSVFSQGVNQSSVGSDKVNAIINVHLATGRIGRPGMGPFSVTGQPNAMGGREVGGLANQLAAHMGFELESIDRVRRFWGFEQIATQPGLQAVALFDAMARGEIKAVWIMGTNPAVSMPRANHVRDALNRCEFVVVSDCVSDTDTTAYADVLFPAKGWGEKDGTVTNSERCISRQRRFIGNDGSAQADWWIISQVAARMGFSDAFDYTCSADIFREHAALSGFENKGERDFDISALAHITNEEYDNLQPSYWPWPANGRKTTRPGDIFRNDFFYTDNHKARFIPVQRSGTSVETSPEYSLLLNTGRLRDQWHTMTRTANAPRLNRHAPEPLLSLHPLDARRAGVADGQIARIESRNGYAELRVRVSQSVRPGQAFAPMHWSSRFASAALVGSLLEGECDPLSGQPELKVEAVSVQPAGIEWHGLVLERSDLQTLIGQVDEDYWVRTRFEHCSATYLGFVVRPDNWLDWATAQMPDAEQLVTYDGGETGVVVVGISDERLQQLMVLSKNPRNRDVGWLAELFSEAPLSVQSKRALMRGLPPQLETNTTRGEPVCVCRGTGRSAIEDSIAKNGMTTTDSIGAALGAGSYCGSCLPEIRQMVDKSQ